VDAPLMTFWRYLILAAFLVTAAPAWADMDGAWAAYDRGDYKTAAELFRAEAEQGNADAQYMMGAIYNDGDIGPRDYAAAANWYDKAAAQGQADAQNSLGYLYDFGLGVARDQAKAEQLYESAAAAGNLLARNNIAYEWSLGGRRLDEALAYAREATAKLPEEGAYQDTLGWALYRLRRYVEALPPLCRAAKLDPASPEIHAHLGDAYWHLGFEENARMQWQQAFDLADRPQLLDVEGQDFLYAEGATFLSSLKARLAGGPGDGPAPDAVDPAAVSQLLGGDCELPTS
jgi:TPR repeat protein